MPPPYDDYSDSDESVEDIQTNVLLGLPDGPISSASDLAKPRISRIGGHPVYTNGTSKPPLSASRCQSCCGLMELLVQLWCPFESSAYDRTLHIWGCSRAQCQRKEGSVKAIRALRYNSKYAAKLEAKRLREPAKKAATPKIPTVNPFSSTAASAGTQLFGGGFDDDDKVAKDRDSSGSSPGDPSSTSEDEDEDDLDENAVRTGGLPMDSVNVESMTSALRDVNISKEGESTSEPAPVITTIPSHPPLYLDTMFEYIAPVANNNVAAERKKTIDRHESGSGGSENQWGPETYEKTQGIDEVFTHFVSRVENESQQCIRYDLSGVPLPFASDAVYKRLFPLAHSVIPTPGAHVIATGGHEGRSTSGGGGKRIYDPTIIPPCNACKAPRAFECQLMPNLINVIRQARRAREDSNANAKNKTGKMQTNEERRAEVAKLLRGETNKSDEDAVTNCDMEWGTCMVFSCVENCCRAKNADGNWSDAQVAWKDEYVLVQWDA